MVFFVGLMLTSSVIGQSDIHSIDFKNFTYPAMCIGAKPSNITVKDGEFSQEKQEDGYIDRFYFNVLGVAYGDLNRDQNDEAIILTSCNTGGTGNFSEGFVYTLKSGKPALTARIAGGDRAYGGLRSTRVEGGFLVVESNDVGPEGGACCPQVIVTTKYRLGTKGGILKVGKETRRDIYPSERVAFAAGTSEKTIRVTIPGDEGKRFVVGARANQTLTASVDTDKASLRLIEDADIKTGTNSLSARLPANGNYTVEVQNDADVPLTVTVTIRIN